MAAIQKCPGMQDMNDADLLILLAEIWLKALVMQNRTNNN